jgi:hypothetical protein
MRCRNREQRQNQAANIIFIDCVTLFIHRSDESEEVLVVRRVKRLERVIRVKSPVREVASLWALKVVRRGFTNWYPNVG